MKAAWKYVSRGGKQGEDVAAGSDATAAPPVLRVPMLDGLTATMLDEMILRGEPQLRKYWSVRHAASPDCSRHILDNRKEIEVGRRNTYISS